MSHDLIDPVTVLEPLPPEYHPNLDHLVMEDGKPVDNIFAEKLLRLLSEALYSSWAGPGEGRPFAVFANVGLFSDPKKPPLSPDVMLSTDVEVGADLSRRANRSYLIWEFGKPPDVVIEVISDRRGGEEGLKMRQYARLAIPYYVIFDPENRLGNGVLRSFFLDLHQGAYQPLPANWFPRVQLGVTLWEGAYEGHATRWLRWCNEQGQVIPTGRERAEQERLRADRLAAQLRELGVNPTQP